MSSLREELKQRDHQIQQLQKRLSTLDVLVTRDNKKQAELGESERVRKQQHQQLLLVSRGRTGAMSSTVKQTHNEQSTVGDHVNEDMEMMQV